jgi:replicative DNA helicase
MTEPLVVREQEAALLGAVMRNGKIYEQAREIVVPESFLIHTHRWLWTAFENLYQNQMSIDVITAGDELERMGKMQEFCRGINSGRVFLSELRATGDPKSFLSYAENVQDYAAKRQITGFLSQGATWAANGRRAKDIIADMAMEFSKVTLYSAADEYTVPVKTAVSEAFEWTAKASRGELVGIPTGLMDLDWIIGGLYPQNVYIAAGRPGTGKTAFLLQIAAHAGSLGKRVGAFMLESGRASAAHRLMAQHSKIDLGHLVTGRLTPEEWERYPKAVDEIGKLPIVINDLSNININQIRQTARKIKATGGLDLLLIDYIQLAQPADKRKQGTREQDVSAVSAGLKYLARELDVPILAAAQLSRANEQRSEKRPVLSDLRESGSLEQDAYAVLFLYGTDPYEKSTSNIKAVDCIIAKHRNGKVGTATFRFNSPYVLFESTTTQVHNMEGL